MSFTIDIVGLRELIAKLDKFPKELEQDANALMQRGAEVFVLNAKRDAPKDFGFLTQGITWSQTASLSFEMVSAAFYSPYQEFGTIKYVFYGENWITPEIEAYAMTFKGKGLRKNGSIYPHPFFFKQLPLAKATIEKGFDALNKKYVL